jgi:hypothetical protein
MGTLSRLHFADLVQVGCYRRNGTCGGGHRSKGEMLADQPSVPLSGENVPKTFGSA